MDKVEKAILRSVRAIGALEAERIFLDQIGGEPESVMEKALRYRRLTHRQRRVIERLAEAGKEQ